MRYALDDPAVADRIDGLSAKVAALPPCPYRAWERVSIDPRDDSATASIACSIARPASGLAFRFGGTSYCAACCKATTPQTITNAVLEPRIAKLRRMRLTMYHDAPAAHVFGALDDIVRAIAERDGLAVVQECLLKARGTGMSVQRAAELEAVARDALDLAEAP